MFDIKNSDSVQSVDDEQLSVSGGRINNYGTIRCDNCNAEGGVPLNSGHLCINCIKSLKDTIGADAVANMLKPQSVSSELLDKLVAKLAGKL